MPKGTLQLFSLSHDTERRRNNARQKSNLFLCMGEVGIDGFQRYCGDNGECVLVDRIDVVIHGMPMGVEGAITTVLYYVDGGDVSDLVYIEMVVEDGSAEFVDKDIAVSQ